MNIKLPRIIGSNLEVHPLSLSVSLDITPLSTASMRLPKDENLPSRGYVEVFTPIGSAGIFRVRSPEDAYGDDITSAQLEHAISEVGDYLILTEISEMMPATTAMQTVFSHYRGSRWQLGSVSALGSGSVAVECNYERVLDAMLGILQQRPSCMMSFDFSTSPWTVNIVARDSTVSAEGRLSRNIRSAKIVTDDTELCTRIYFQIPSTNSEGEPIQVWTHTDADTIGTYGVVERELQGGSDYTESEARAAASEYLRQHKHPRTTISIGGEELSSITGEPLDRFTIGKLMRLALPDYNMTVTETITGISWADVFNDPWQMTVRLGAEEDTVINFLHDVDKKGGTDGGNGGGHGGGGGGRKSTEDVWKEFRVRFEQDDYHFGVISEHVDHAENVLEAAGMDVNSQTGAIIYHDDVANGVGARLTAQANALNGTQSQVAMVVGHGSGGNFIKAAEIAIAMNNSTGETEAKINADHVYIGNDKSTTVIAGKAEVSDLNAVKAHVDNLTGGTIVENFCKASLVVGTTVTANNTFVHDGDTIYKRNLIWATGGSAIATVHATGGATSISLNHSHDMTVDSSGNVTVGDAQTTQGTFNIADTAFYKSRVASAWDAGGGTAKADKTSQYAPYGGSVVIKIQYLDHSGVTKDTGRSVTIWNSNCSHSFGEREFSSNGTFYASTYGYSGFSKVIVSGVRSTSHSNCAESLTKSGTYAILYAPDSSGTTISVKVKNISAAGRCWYYGSNQTLKTMYT